MTPRGKRPVQSEHSVAEAALAAGLGGPAHYRAEVGSTNTELVRLARAGEPAWSVFVAGFQAAGRGRLGRSWVAPPGTSLMVSLLLRPALAPAEAPLVSLAAGVCLARALERACALDVRCKWPNDLVVGDRKLGGILSETEVEGPRLTHVVIGAGVNVLQRPGDFPPELDDAATSVSIEGGRQDPDGLLREYLAGFRGDFDPDEEGFRGRTLDAYRRRCDTLGRRVAATTIAGVRVEGEAVSIGEHGQLLVRTSGGTVEVTFGEVEHLR
jgi:BirA family biotin operon repressor/biotin-[acetyl-CoA-carboxylase] ligase